MAHVYLEPGLGMRGAVPPPLFVVTWAALDLVPLVREICLFSGVG